MAVAIGVDHRNNIPAFFGGCLLWYAEGHIILYFWTVVAPSIDLILQAHRHMENIDDHRCYGCHALVNGRCEPSCPTAFREAGDYIIIDRKMALLHEKGLRGIHGTYGTFHHRK